MKRPAASHVSFNQVETPFFLIQCYPAGAEKENPIIHIISLLLLLFLPFLIEKLGDCVIMTRTTASAY